MVQPLPSNSDNDELAKQAGVQQGLDNGSSNSGSMQGASAGGDANLVNGNNNQFNKVEQQTVIIFPSSKSEVVKPNTSSQETSQVQHIYLVSSAILAFFILLSGTAFFYPLFAFRLNGESPMEECTTAKQSNVIKIVMANFGSSQSSPKLLLKERFSDELLEQKWENVEICSIEKNFLTDQEAKKVGNKFNADIVIWGRQDISHLEIFIETTHINVPYLNKLPVPVNDAFKSDSKTQSWANLVPVMVAFHLSEIYSSQNQVSKARQILDETLQIAEIKVDKDLEDNRKVLATAYFFLGLLIEEELTKNCEQETRILCLKALYTFQKASELNGKLYDAFFNQAYFYERLEIFDEAIKLYTEVINSNSNKTVVKQARKYRALVYLKKDEPEEALPDIETICQQSPEDIDCLLWLGKTQLQARKTLEAEKTYKKLKNFLDADDKLTTVEGNKLQSEILTSLQELSDKDLSLSLERFSAMFK